VQTGLVAQLKIGKNHFVFQQIGLINSPKDEEKDSRTILKYLTRLS
jgi:hypothetical protein